MTRRPLHEVRLGPRRDGFYTDAERDAFQAKQQASHTRLLDDIQATRLREQIASDPDLPEDAGVLHPEAPSRQGYIEPEYLT